MSLEFDPKAAWVRVILKELNVPVSVASLSDRISMQKAVYLAQAKGVNLGYRFSWYLNGPYSSALADTYYLIKRDQKPYESYTASEEFKSKLKPVQGLIQEKPAAANIADWLEATGSLDFMVRVMAKPLESAVAQCMKEKPKLEGLFKSAKEALVKFEFLVDGP